MKLKNEFVTNSSSCSYLVFIPDKFEVDKFLHLIEDNIKEMVATDWYDNEDIKTKDQAIEAIKKDIESLQNFGSIWQNEGSYYAVVSLLEKLDLVLGEPETGGGDGSGAMMNINGTQYREKLSTIIKGGWGLKHGGWGIETKI